jgi:hypothetical protein
LQVNVSKYEDVAVMVAKGNFELIRQRWSLREVGNAYLPKNSINSITVPSGSSQQNTFIQPPPKYTRAGAL